MCTLQKKYILLLSFKFITNHWKHPSFNFNQKRYLYLYGALLLRGILSMQGSIPTDYFPFGAKSENLS